MPIMACFLFCDKTIEIPEDCMSIAKALDWQENVRLDKKKKKRGFFYGPGNLCQIAAAMRLI